MQFCPTFIFCTAKLTLTIGKLVGALALFDWFRERT